MAMTVIVSEPGNSPLVDASDRLDYSRVMLVRALESFSKWDKEAIKEDKNWGWEAKIVVINLAEKAAEFEPEKVLDGVVSFLSREQYKNPTLASILCKSIASYLTYACIGATKKRVGIVSKMVASGMPYDQAEAKAAERITYDGAVTDVYDPQYQASLELMIESSEELHMYLNDYYVNAEAEAFSRSRRIGCLPWATFNIGDEYNAIWQSCVTLDDAMSMAAKAEHAKAEQNKELNATSAKNMDEDFG